MIVKFMNTRTGKQEMINLRNKDPEEVFGQGEADMDGEQDQDKE